MRFTKMHGLGNDFAVLDARSTPVADPARLAQQMCDRRRGVGGDGILIIEPPDQAGADFRFRNFNADGSESEMCGNGIRCTHLFLARRSGPARVRWSSGAGLVVTEGMGEIRGRTGLVRVDMGAPRLEAAAIPVGWQDLPRVVDQPLSVDGVELRVTCVSMGNPHAVTFASPEGFPLERLGPAVEHHPAFPQRTNFEVVEVLAPDRLRLRVWERGVGETEACGTGACAAAVAVGLVKQGRYPMSVELPGGSLTIDWDGAGSVFMTGPATEVFEGEWPQ
jgi:diaminopimelate epimerase